MTAPDKTRLEPHAAGEVRALLGMAQQALFRAKAAEAPYGTPFADAGGKDRLARYHDAEKTIAELAAMDDIADPAPEPQR